MSSRTLAASKRTLAIAQHMNASTDAAATAKQHHLATDEVRPVSATGLWIVRSERSHAASRQGRTDRSNHEIHSQPTGEAQCTQHPDAGTSLRYRPRTPLSLSLGTQLRHYGPQNWSKSSLSRILVGTGAGRAFCAGGDVASTCPVSKFAAIPNTDRAFYSRCGAGCRRRRVNAESYRLLQARVSTTNLLELTQP